MAQWSTAVPDYVDLLWLAHLLKSYRRDLVMDRPLVECNHGKSLLDTNVQVEIVSLTHPLLVIAIEENQAGEY